MRQLFDFSIQWLIKGFETLFSSSGVEIEGSCDSVAGVPAHKSPTDDNASNSEILALSLTLTGQLTCHLVMDVL